MRISRQRACNGRDSKGEAVLAESGGPPVSVPQHKGFGSLRIEQSFAGYGETCFDFAADGVRVELSLV